MRVLNSLVCMAVASSFSLGCAKDKNMQDFQTDQAQQQIAKINAVAGIYTGEAISGLDNTKLGTIKLNFKPNTVVQSGSTSSPCGSSQNIVVGGQVNLSGLSNASVSFNNGQYCDNTGEFEVTIPVVLIDKTQKIIDLKGHISGSQFIGSLSIDQDLNYQANLSLTKNAPASNIDKLEITGARIHQIARTDAKYFGDFQSGNEAVTAQLYFVDKETSADKQFYKLISPRRLIDAYISNKYYTLSFPNSTIDDSKIGDSLGTIDGSSTSSTLHCDRFENGKTDSGYDCTIYSKLKPIKIHMSAEVVQ